MRIKPWLVVLAALAFPVAAAANPDVFGIPTVNLSPQVLAPMGVQDAPAAEATLAPPTSALMQPLVDFVRRRPAPYRPRLRRSPTPVMPLAAQIYIGFFNPIDNFSTGFDGGFRIGSHVNPHMQVGLAMDWWHRSDDRVLDLGNVEAPGGTAREELILSESTANLIPVLMYVQVNGREDMPVVPYAGFGVGYEWLFLTAHDYLTHESFDQTFGGLGWQAWMGAGLPLDWRTRLSAEVFFNGCETDSEVDVIIQDYGPATVRDVVKMNGVGIRFGLFFRF